MKRILIVGLCFFGIFIAILAIFLRMTGQLTDTVIHNRNEMAGVSQLASNTIEAETQLAQITSDQRKMLQNPLPTPIQVLSTLNSLAQTHHLTLTATPSTVANNQKQIFGVTVTATAAHRSDIISFLNDLENGSLFVGIQKLTFENHSAGDAALSQSLSLELLVGVQ